MATAASTGLILRRLKRTNGSLQKIIEERRAFTALIDNSPNFISITDPDGRSVRINPSGRRMVGLTADFPLENAIAAGHFPAGATTIVQDLSTLKELEHLREEWASVVAHDLQQPISVIVLRSDLLLQEGLTGSQEDDIREIRNAARRLSRMVNDLMDASQLETSRMRITLDRLDLGELVRAIVAQVPDAAPRTVIRTPIDNRLFVKGDAQRLEQVVTNLLSNALKYGTPGTQIVVDVRDAGGHAEVLVTNRGQGIPGDELPFLFERYFRSRAARTSATKGSGLGLYIAKGLVEAHGGHIWAESTPAETTTFHFTVPLDGPPIPTSVLPPSSDEAALQPEFKELQP
jgi:signal transduction histidine kinase